MATVRPMEPRDVGPVMALMEDMAVRSENLGSPFFDTVSTRRNNGFVETLKRCMDNPEHSLLLVGEHSNGEVVAVLLAHVCLNYPYAKSQLDVFVSSLWLKEQIAPIVAGRILIHGTMQLREFSRTKGCGVIFGNIYHADERARKLMRRLHLKATYIRYEAEVD